MDLLLGMKANISMIKLPGLSFKTNKTLLMGSSSKQKTRRKQLKLGFAYTSADLI